MKRITLGDILIYFSITVFSLCCILPMLLVLMISITDEKTIRQSGYSFLPRKFSLEAYRMLFSDSDILINSYSVSVFVTVAGTAAAVVITAMAAYTLANRHVKYRNTIALMFFFTMIFNGGIVPWYIICTKLGLRDNLLALIIPVLIFSPFNLFLVRNYMAGIPESLMESARIDGAGDFRIIFRIYFPLCLPVLATVALFYGLGYWNDWWNAIMLVDNKRLFPVQYLLFKLQSDIRMLTEVQGASSASGAVLPAESVKMATAIVTVGPIVLMYPYLQRYFIKGLIIGSVKG